ncbi:MAG TPA: ABC transporter permease [Candidatus Faecousia intestinigallinarum]|nr:ABC transporter permease [Candidatus Faecousia intestinigallinarum]
MKFRFFPALRHAARMAARNRRSYGLLSVTVTLSLTLLLGYLAFSDAAVYNRYKEVFPQPSNLVVVETGTPEAENLLPALDNMVALIDPDARMIPYYKCHSAMLQYGRGVTSVVYLIPEGSVPLSVCDMGGVSHSTEEITMAAGRDSLTLHGNEAVISQNLFDVLGLEGEFPITLMAPLNRIVEGGNGVWYDMVELSIVGICASTSVDYPLHYENEEYYQGDAPFPVANGVLITTQAVLGQFQVELEELAQNECRFLCSSHAEEIASRADEMSTGMQVGAPSLAMANARKEMAGLAESKLYTVALLLLILGLNLYSSFENALSERRFEIGVKRAIGASALDIVRQFLLESTLVMLLNILLSVVLVADGLIVYKLFLRLTAGQEWVAWISPYSVAMFAICAVSLTLLFSLIFACKAASVEIVRHLKAE